jgi:hypothetical protein
MADRMAFTEGCGAPDQLSMEIYVGIPETPDYPSGVASADCINKDTKSCDRRVKSRQQVARRKSGAMTEGCKDADL